MSRTTLETDYLVIGSGAMGMAFTDVLITETDAKVVMVDRHHQPGGHWNDAYPYVRLHQASAYYGVNSRELGSGAIDATGWNKGLYELATNSEVCAYFDQVMQQQFLPSGRVEYFPMCDYRGSQHFASLVSDAEYEVVAKKIVDATYMNVTVPSMRRPVYEVAESANCVPPNTLPRLTGKWDRYIVVGAGKTGMDACLFLLKNDVDPDQIAWIMPRDSWLYNRSHLQAGEMFAQSLGRLIRDTFKAVVNSRSIADLFAHMEANGHLLRLDETVWPTMWRCATVSQGELEQLRRIKDIIRSGRVQCIEANRIVLDKSTVQTSPTTLHVDCTANGLEKRLVKPVFAGGQITLQPVRSCQQVFSAAFIGHIESAYENEARKNELCTPVPHPDTYVDYLHTILADFLNAARWAEEPELQMWLRNTRLNPTSPSDSPSEADPELARRVVASVKAGAEKLRVLLSEFDAQARC